MRKPKPHPIHSGDFPFIFEGDNHYHTHTHVDHLTHDALAVCLTAIRGLPNKAKRENLIGHLLAELVHEHQIDGLLRSLDLASHAIDRYNVPPQTRSH